MAKPYHTLLWHEYGSAERNVYHDKKKCPAGSRIKPEHRETGKGVNRVRCKLCQARD